MRFLPIPSRQPRCMRARPTRSALILRCWFVRRAAIGVHPQTVAAEMILACVVVKLLFVRMMIPGKSAAAHSVLALPPQIALLL